MAVTKEHIENALGTISKVINLQLRDAGTLKEYLDQFNATPEDPDSLQVQFGFDDTRAARVKSAINDLDKLRQIDQGLTDQDDPYDFRTFAKYFFDLGY